MANEQDWQTESYKGMDVHVSALQRAGGQWDFTVRVAYPGEDTSAESELNATSGDAADYSTREAALQAGFAKAYGMVDRLQA